MLRVGALEYFLHYRCNLQVIIHPDVSPKHGTFSFTLPGITNIQKLSFSPHEILQILSTSITQWEVGAEAEAGKILRSAVLRFSHEIDR